LNRREKRLDLDSAMEDKLVTIAEYMDSIEAELARQVLEDFKIPAIVVGQNATSIWLPTTLPMTAKLQVLESDAVKAKEILDEQQQGHEPEEFEVMDESDEADDIYDPQEEEQ